MQIPKEHKPDAVSNDEEVSDMTQAPEIPNFNRSSEQLFDERSAAKRLCYSPALLRKWRLFGQGPAYHKIGRLVRYSETDLKEYIESCRKEAA